jgi:hypothetical protein
MIDTGVVSEAFIRRLYAKGSLSINEAEEILADCWPESERGWLQYHLQMLVGHFLGVLEDDGVSPHNPVIIPDPQSNEQRWAWEADRRGTVTDKDEDAWHEHWNTIPWRFAPGWRRRYQQHKFNWWYGEPSKCKHCGSVSRDTKITGGIPKAPPC